MIAWLATTHLYKLHEGWDNNRVIGLTYQGYFAGTFITTHGPRGWVGGFERSWWEGRAGPVRTMIGFRAGLVYGYDHRLGYVADAIPILPYAQPVALARWGPVSLDVSYTWVVASVTGGVTLW